MPVLVVLVDTSPGGGHVLGPSSPATSITGRKGGYYFRRLGKYCHVSPFKISDSVPVPREVWKLSGPQHSGPHVASAASVTQERPPVLGVPAACRACSVGQAAGMSLWGVLWLQILVATDRIVLWPRGQVNIPDFVASPEVGCSCFVCSFTPQMDLLSTY